MTSQHSQPSQSSRSSQPPRSSQPSQPSQHSQASQSSRSSQPPQYSLPPRRPLTKPRGDFKTLLTYQKAEILYDLTLFFTQTFLERGDRTRDQMLQAARSGKQNIAEGSAAANTSAETEIKLTNVAKGSLIELRTDYEDYLRTRGHKIWEKDSAEAQAVRQKSRDSSVTSAWYLEIAKTRPPEVTANICLCLLHQTDYLLQRQLTALEDKFLAEGGFKERMYAARLESRGRQNPTCPQCGNSMELRTARQGAQKGQQFWGCSKFPQCSATIAITPPEAKEIER